MKNKAIVGSYGTQSEQIIKSKGINVHCTDYTSDVIKTYNRKDFYKVCLYFGEAMIEYADKGINIKLYKFYSFFAGFDLRIFCLIKPSGMLKKSLSRDLSFRA